MFQIVVEKECGCFRRSDLQNNVTLESKDEALSKALEMVNVMNGEFCKKHSFKVEEAGDTFVIKMD